LSLSYVVLEYFFSLPYDPSSNKFSIHRMPKM